MTSRPFPGVLLALLLAGCAATPPDYDPATDAGTLWVATSAEYDALTRQAYAVATRTLPELIEDTSFSAMPDQTGADALPPAVILDMDETVVDNVGFQLVYEPPFTEEKFENWLASTKAKPIEGVVDFIRHARSLGVEVFFVTNRACDAPPGSSDPCPQRQTAIDDLAEIGITADAEHMLLSNERGWTKEKLSRRQYVARTHRVLMIFGDDFGDFVFCSRAEAALPCEVDATRQSRADAVERYSAYWGYGWYVLPNPMYGSWTYFIED